MAPHCRALFQWPPLLGSLCSNHQQAIQNTSLRLNDLKEICHPSPRLQCSHNGACLWFSLQHQEFSTGNPSTNILKRELLIQKDIGCFVPSIILNFLNSAFVYVKGLQNQDSLQICLLAAVNQISELLCTPLSFFGFQFELTNFVQYISNNFSSRSFERHCLN